MHHILDPCIFWVVLRRQSRNHAFPKTTQNKLTETEIALAKLTCTWRNPLYIVSVCFCCGPRSVFWWQCFVSFWKTFLLLLCLFFCKCHMLNLANQWIFGNTPQQMFYDKSLVKIWRVSIHWNTSRLLISSGEFVFLYHHNFNKADHSRASY